MAGRAGGRRRGGDPRRAGLADRPGPRTGRTGGAQLLAEPALLLGRRRAAGDRLPGAGPAGPAGAGGVPEAGPSLRGAGQHPALLSREQGPAGRRAGPRRGPRRPRGAGPARPRPRLARRCSASTRRGPDARSPPSPLTDSSEFSVKGEVDVADVAPVVLRQVIASRPLGDPTWAASHPVGRPARSS